MTRVRSFEAGGQTLVLREQDGRIDVLLGNVVLLSSAALETELAFGRLAPAGARRVIVGGLGFGATVRGVLEVAAADARIEVVEKVAAAAVTEPVDAILLDVDNGPEWASFRTNARLYATDALSRAWSALASGGIYAVWSGYPADAFQGKLRKAGFTPEIVPLREKGLVRARAYVGRKTALESA